MNKRIAEMTKPVDIHRVPTDIVGPTELPADVTFALYYGRWTLAQLKRKGFTPGAMMAYGATEPEGYYGIRLAKLDPNLPLEQQLSCPSENDGWICCPVTIAVTAVLLGFEIGRFASCSENATQGHKIAVSCHSEILIITSTLNAEWNGTTFPHVQRMECKKIG